MNDEKWDASEKHIARRIFDKALRQELLEIMNSFKTQAASVQNPENMWSIQEYLENSRRRINVKYDERYSQMRLLLGILLREGRINEDELNGLSKDKLDDIHRIASIIEN